MTKGELFEKYVDMEFEFSFATILNRAIAEAYTEGEASQQAKIDLLNQAAIGNREEMDRLVVTNKGLYAHNNQLHEMNAALNAQAEKLAARVGLLSRERDVYYNETGKLNGVISGLQAQAGQMANEIAALKAAGTYDQQVAADIFNGQRGKIENLKAQVKKLSDELAEAKKAAAYDVQGLASQLEEASRSAANQFETICTLRKNYGDRLNDIENLRAQLGAAELRLRESDDS